MKYIFFICFTCLAIFSKAQNANTNISNTNVFGGEPYLAINPLNPKNIIIGWMALDAGTSFKMTIRTKVSFDGFVKK